VTFFTEDFELELEDPGGALGPRDLRKEAEWLLVSKYQLGSKPLMAKRIICSFIDFES
jgi:hypothetical protein